MASMKITMPRGDLRKIKFQITTASGEPFLTPDEVFFTVKDSTTSKKVCFQKKLSDGSITLGEDNYYHFIIQPEDTDGLKYQDYKFDIEVLGTELKQTQIGTLTITDEVTFHTDEGVDDSDG